MLALAPTALCVMRLTMAMTMKGSQMEGNGRKPE
jgi:hypothetical protein